MTGITYGAYTSDTVDRVSAKRLEVPSGGTIGFFGTTAATRPNVTYNATITATYTQGTNGFGFSSSDQFLSVVGAVKDIQHVLTTLGLWE